MDYAPVIESKRLQFADLEKEIAADGFFDDARASADTLRIHRGLLNLLTAWDSFEKIRTELADSQELAKSDDEEMAAMAREELPRLEKELADIEAKIQLFILPPDPLEGRDALLEIRAGTGGDEASLFASDLVRMYTRFAEVRGWKTEVLEASSSDVGGTKETVLKISGEDVFRVLKYESGVHRVQRVPATEAQGRIHTSTATVAVLPEAEEVDLQIPADEIRIEVCRAGGHGGQGVNTTDSAVQVLHIPTGTIVRCQDGRSQIKNKEKALSILRSRLLERKQQEEAEKYSAQRRNLIGSGGREEKIRTYNFPQNRLTDHRVDLTLYNLDQVMEGKLDQILETLLASDLQERLAEAGLR